MAIHKAIQNYSRDGKVVDQQFVPIGENKDLCLVFLFFNTDLNDYVDPEHISIPISAQGITNDQDRTLYS